jgi:enoyl-CoA hydratase/carnithine racemase
MREFSLGRRRFTLGAAVAATTALILPADALPAGVVSQTAGPASPPPVALTPLEQQAQTAMAKLSPRAQAEVEMKVSEIFRKYGDKLSAEQKTDIRKVMAETQDGLEKMRAFALDNGDQPATVFHAYRAEGNK